MGRVRPSEESAAFQDSPTAFDGEARNLRSLQLSISRRRFWIGAVILCSAFFLLIGRSAHLQIMQGTSYRALAEGNRVRSYTLLPPRGLIYDRHGHVLVENAPAFLLTMTIADLPTDDQARSIVLNRVADLAGMQRTDLDLLISKYAENPFDAIPVKKSIQYEPAMRLAIETAALPGFSLHTSSRRQYTNAAPSLSHVLGYIGKITADELGQTQNSTYRPTDEIGKIGIERSEEDVLRGVPGKRVVEVDARGQELAVVSKEAPIPGGNLTLSIDLKLQKFIEEQVASAFEQSGATRASVVVIDPQTGAVRALVSLPTFDSNTFSTGIDPETYARLVEDPDLPLFPRAISGEFPSGSVFKPFVAYAALKEGIITPNTSFFSSGGIRINEWFFPDWRAGGHGITNVYKAISDSVNTFFYIIGGGYEQTAGLGVDRITDYARKFGFGSPTGIGLPGEGDGFLPSKEWKEEVKAESWYIGDTYHLAIGQGDLLVTPLQMAVATGIIANGGTPISPYLVEGVDGWIPPDWQPNHLPANEEPFDPDDIDVIRQAMRRTVTQGTARSHDSLPIEVAGKTGTAQTPGDEPTHAWFTGFAPYDHPEIAVAVLIEHGGEGSSIASPIARAIFQWWYDNE